MNWCTSIEEEVVRLDGQEFATDFHVDHSANCNFDWIRVKLELVDHRLKSHLLDYRILEILLLRPPDFFVCSPQHTIIGFSNLHFGKRLRVAEPNPLCNHAHCIDNRLRDGYWQVLCTIWSNLCSLPVNMWRNAWKTLIRSLVSRRFLTLIPLIKSL